MSLIRRKKRPPSPVAAFREMWVREIDKLNKQSQTTPDSIMTPAVLTQMSQLWEKIEAFEEKAKPRKPLNARKLTDTERHLLIWCHDIEKFARSESGDHPGVPTEVLADNWARIAPGDRLATWRALAKAIAADLQISEVEAYRRVQALFGFPPGEPS